MPKFTALDGATIEVTRTRERRWPWSIKNNGRVVKSSIFHDEMADFFCMTIENAHTEINKLRDSVKSLNIQLSETNDAADKYKHLYWHSPHQMVGEGLYTSIIERDKGFDNIVIRFDNIDNGTQVEAQFIDINTIPKPKKNYILPILIVANFTVLAVQLFRMFH